MYTNISPLSKTTANFEQTENKLRIYFKSLEPSAIVALAAHNAASDAAADQCFGLFFAVQILRDDLVKDVKQGAVHVVVVDDRYQIIGVMNLCDVRRKEKIVTLNTMREIIEFT